MSSAEGFSKLSKFVERYWAYTWSGYGSFEETPLRAKYRLPYESPRAFLEIKVVWAAWVGSGR
jgi:hypothetical protein